MNSPGKNLLEHNPFYTNAAANPWENRYPDVESINIEAFLGISRLTKEKSRNPEDPLSVLILGDAGSGKTHLLQRILNSTINIDANTSFVNIKPILNPNAPLRHLLKGIMVDLGRDNISLPGYTQLHRIITKMVIEFLSYKSDKTPETFDILENNPWRFFHNKHNGKSELSIFKEPAIEHFHSTNSEISTPFLKVLFQLDDDNKRGILIDWLKGEPLDEEDCKRLGVGDREGKDEFYLENEAREILISLGILMRRYHQTLLVCFDQLDNLKSPELITGFNLILHTIINDIPGILPIIFVRPDSWNLIIKDKIELPLYQRLENNIFTLKGCTQDQADEIIRLRIQFIFKDQWQESYHWLYSKLDGKIKPGYSPRQIILLANRVIQSSNEHASLVINPLEVLAEQYRNECDLVMADFETWPPDRDQLELALVHFLKTQGNIENVHKKDKDRINPYAVITDLKSNKKSYGFIINTREHHSSLSNCFQRAVEFIEKESGKSIFITDPRCLYTKPGWKATNSKMKEFLDKGGEICKLEKSDIARWYALAALIFKINEGDISVEGEGGILRTVTENELNTFMGTESYFGKPLFALKTPDFIPPPSPPDYERLFEDVCSHLQKSPMKLLSTALLLDKVNTSGHNISHEQLLEFCGKKKDIFLIYLIKQGSSIMLKGTCHI